jgi:hypothetical protein
MRSEVSACINWHSTSNLGPVSSRSRSSAWADSERLRMIGVVVSRGLRLLNTRLGEQQPFACRGSLSCCPTAPGSMMYRISTLVSNPIIWRTHRGGKSPQSAPEIVNRRNAVSSAPILPLVTLEFARQSHAAVQGSRKAAFYRL